jgi:hypothetical protein
VAPGLCTVNAGTYAIRCADNTRTGIHAKLISGNTAVIRNGTVQGFLVGIAMGNGAAENLIVRHNNDTGLYVEARRGSRATAVTAALNQSGIFLVRGVIERSIASHNDRGIAGDSPTLSAISDSQARVNRIGISSASVHASQAEANQTNGLNPQTY